MRYTLLTLVLIILFSCSEDPTRVKKSKNTINKEIFIKILADIHTMDALTNRPDYYRKYDEKDSVDLYGNIFLHYGVEKVDFDSTIAWYSKNPELYLEIYNQVILELNYRRDTLTDNHPVFDKKRKNK